MEPQNTIIEPTNKNHRILFTVVTILLTAVVVGGSVWYALNQELKKQSAKIEELQKNQTAKKTEVKTEAVAKADITKVDFKKLIEKTNKIGSFLQTNYGDLTGDRDNEALVRFKNDGTGGYLDVYIYGYQNGELKQLFKKEALYMGEAEIKNYTENVLHLTYVDLKSPQNEGRPNSDLSSTTADYYWDNGKFIER